ncbi:hypothetical protein [Paracidovorax citrulli]
MMLPSQERLAKLMKRAAVTLENTLENARCLTGSSSGRSRTCRILRRCPQREAQQRAQWQAALAEAL